jgi:hypothetical protein
MHKVVGGKFNTTCRHRTAKDGPPGLEAVTAMQTTTNVQQHHHHQQQQRNFSHGAHIRIEREHTCKQPVHVMGMVPIGILSLQPLQLVLVEHAREDRPLDF